jgi:hypothetical protein
MNQRGPDYEKLSMVQTLLDESTERIEQLLVKNRWVIYAIFFSDC